MRIPYDENVSIERHSGGSRNPGGRNGIRPNGGTRSVGSGVYLGLQGQLGRNGMRPSKQFFFEGVYINAGELMSKEISWLSILLVGCAGLNPAVEATKPAESVALVPRFEMTSFMEPEAHFWPGYFWLWNGELNPEEIIRQLGDMATHDARSVCMLPMPHGFRPGLTNNLMAPDYLTPEFFERVRTAVDEAARLEMNWWLYDEGGWPSGRALGKVVEGHPELCMQRMVREAITPSGTAYQVPSDVYALVVEKSRKVVRPGEVWNPQEGEQAFLYRIISQGAPDLLNPQAVQRFINLTHEGYKNVIQRHFGNTVRSTFTDEPAVPPPDPDRNLPWTPGMEVLWREKFGEPIEASLPVFFKAPGNELSLEDQAARVRLYDLWTERFKESYFVSLLQWGRDNGLTSAGHLGGEDETINAVTQGFGHVLRPLRAMDIPGVDLIWRQIFPTKTGTELATRHKRPDFQLFAASAAHQNGTRYAFTESFCVYGNGLTLEEMRWLTDYQYVRGLNLLVIGCYQFTTQDHHMTGERPHFGPMNPLWDHIPGYHAYVARLGYALSVGKPKVSTAVYYPVRDLWALGREAGAKTAVSFDHLVRDLLSHQCGVDIIDDDVLAAPTTKIESGELVIGAMRYDTLLVGAVQWMEPKSWEQLHQFATAGGKVFCVDHAPGVDGHPTSDLPSGIQIGSPTQLASEVTRSVSLNPDNSMIRICARSCENGEILFLFNEGTTAYLGEFPVRQQNVYRLDPQTGLITFADLGQQPGTIRVNLVPGESVLFFEAKESVVASPPHKVSADRLLLDAYTLAIPRRQFRVGEHNFEISDLSLPPRNFPAATAWKDWLSEDFSGEVDYQVGFVIPPSWEGAPLCLSTGPIEYAATVLIDDKVVGSLLWQPWKLDLPPLPVGNHKLTIRVANTLANELTSQRVTDLWSQKKGPGWPSPYHARALVFEKETRGGGLQGPIEIQRCSAP
jgi:hypothetical protein